MLLTRVELPERKRRKKMDSTSNCCRRNISIVNKAITEEKRFFVIVDDVGYNTLNHPKQSRASSSIALSNEVRASSRENQFKMQPDRKSRLHYVSKINNHNHHHHQLPSDLSCQAKGESCKKLPTANVFAAKTKLCHLFLKNAPSLTKSVLSLLLLSLLIVSSISDGSQIMSNTPLSRSHQQSMEELTNSLMAPFSPTRSPAQPTGGSIHLRNHQPNVPRTQQQVAPLSGSSGYGHKFLEPKVAASSGSNKFTRTNELEMFLDDMNHNELRNVVAGHPINDLFRPKLARNPVEDDERVRLGEANKHHNDQDKKDEVSRFNSDPKERENNNSREPEEVRLDGSGSERQIYSECALILQRTYVKSINEPK